MPTVTFTAQSIKSLPVPQRGQTDFWDSAVRGFGCRVSEGGVKSWVLVYRFNGRPRRWTIGRFPDLGLADARKRTQSALLQIANGIDPGAAKIEHRQASTFGALATEYMTVHAKRKKKTWTMDQHVIDHELLPYWKHAKVKDLARRDVRTLVERIADPDGRNGPIYANRIRALIHKMFNFALARDYGIDFNPCAGVERPGRERARDRVLTPDEIRAFWNALDAEAQERPMIAALFRIRLLTAQRGGEVSKMRWADVDLQTGWWTIPAEFTKNGLQHRVPLNDAAIRILRDLRAWAERRTVEVNRGRGRKGWAPKPISDWVFPARRLGKEDDKGDQPLDGKLAKGMNRLRKTSGLNNICAHDLRRTAASLMSQMGVARLALKKVLNHVDRDVTAVYDRYSYDREKRAALNAWGLRLHAILRGRDDSKLLMFRS